MIIVEKLERNGIPEPDIDYAVALARKLPIKYEPTEREPELNED